MKTEDSLLAPHVPMTRDEREIFGLRAALETRTIERDATARSFTALTRRFESAVETLKDIAAMGRKAGSESARNRLRELGIDVPDYGSMT